MLREFFVVLGVKNNNRAVFLAFCLFVCFLTLCSMTSHARLAQVTQWHDFSKIFVHGKTIFIIESHKINFQSVKLGMTIGKWALEENVLYHIDFPFS